MKKLFIISILLSLFFISCIKEQAYSVATWSNDIRQEFKV